ncbi:MAG: o-succinylbenzoate--CoA ligase [Desulfobacteraceae bacterium]|nr:o-succinylbenzoate--CoA ligase [Desulfobacteraceae bacterium]
MREFLLHQMLSYWRKEAPDNIALIQEERQISYERLFRRSGRLASSLSHIFKIGKGDRVAVLSNNCIEMVEILFAVSRLGAIFVPINIRLTAPEVEFILSDCTPKALIFNFNQKKLYNEVNQLFPFEQCIQINGQAQPDIHPYEAFLSYKAGIPVEESKDLKDSDTLMLIYTSGTTGKPKGAMLSHSNNIWNCIATSHLLNITKEDVAITILPLFHIGGWGLYLLPMLFQGGKTVIEEQFNPDGIFDLVDNHKITIFMGVPTIYNMISQMEEFNTRFLDSIRMFVTGGAPCPISLIESYQAKGYVLTQGFGMTETSPTVFLMRPEDSLAKKGSVGKPVISCEVKIVDDNFNELPPNTPGELCIRGKVVCEGYWNRPQSTKEATQNGWFQSGDMARFDEDGFFYIVDRKKNMLISGGENVYPAEVEDILFQHTDILEVSVFGIPDKKWGEIPVAAVVIMPGAELSKQAFKEWFQSRLARYKQPKEIYFLDELPKNATGKILKKDLKEEYLSAQASLV